MLILSARMSSSQWTVVAINGCLFLFVLVASAMIRAPGVIVPFCVPVAPLVLVQMWLHIFPPMSPWMTLVTSNVMLAAIEIHLWRNPKPWLAVLLSMYFATGIFLTGFHFP